MKILFLFLGLLSLGTSCKSVAVPLYQDKAYGAGVSFNSICCGPPSEEFLKTFVKGFNLSQKVKITADKIAGCGREGEFVILFNTGKMKADIREKFIADLEKLVPVQEIKNKQAETSSGGVQVVRDVKSSAYSHCRISSQNWAYER